MQQKSIQLWGPTGAGKDWLLRGFIKETELFSQTDPDYFYQMKEIHRDGSDDVGISSVPTNDPTAQHQDLLFEFRRSPKKPAEDYLAIHRIVIQNGKGSDMIRVIQDGQTYDTGLELPLNSDFHILVLDIPQTSLHKNRSDSPPSTTNGEEEDDIFGIGAQEENVPQADQQENAAWGIQDYFRFIQNFFALIDHTNKNVALCMTKADQQAYGGDPWQILERRYGLSLSRFIEMQQQFHRIDVFYTSAAGFMKNPGGMQPNINPQTGEILNEERWVPIKTALPFFWFFEIIEMEYWKNTPRLFRSPKPPKYPKPFSY
jgi:hypothetical protein